MFSGIIQDIGIVKSIQQKDGGMLIVVKTRLAGHSLKAGSSVSVNGVCLTCAKRAGSALYFDIMPKTIEKTKFDFLKSGDKLNLELSLKAGSEIGGHFVYGHVDTVALADKIIKDGDKYVIWFKVGNEFEKYLVERGSVSVDGVSLTISETSGSRFAVSLVDYTLKHTTLSGLKIGDPANVEFDMLAKYCERIILKYEKNRI